MKVWVLWYDSYRNERWWGWGRGDGGDNEGDGVMVEVMIAVMMELMR